MYKLHYDVYLATLKETGAFVTKHTVINYVNVLAVAQQLACLNTPGRRVWRAVPRYQFSVALILILRRLLLLTPV
jgi:hypothetical protein